MIQRITRVAAYVLLTHEGRLLLCRMAPHTRSPGEWTLPGGGIEFGESPEDAAVRETLEETGFQIRLGDLAWTESELVEYEDLHAHAIRFIYHAEILSGELQIEVEGSTDHAEWVPLESAFGLPLCGLANRAVEHVAGQIS